MKQKIKLSNVNVMIMSIEILNMLNEKAGYNKFLEKNLIFAFHLLKLILININR